MITLRRARERGHAQLGWLDTWHTFSFADYYDPKEMGFGTLRVLNDDRVAPGSGFPTHGHRDMEIITWVLEGALEHQDSTGGGSVIRPGEVQRMTAGRGIQHSEYNPSQTEATRLLQIWILPEEQGLPPGYEQQRIPHEEMAGRLRLIASRDGRAGSVTLHQDTDVHVARLAAGEQVFHAPAPGRLVYLHVARGEVGLNGQRLAEGDGAKVDAAESLAVRALSAAEVLLFDMPGTIH
jgi:redox-sensitive bicupin YhaK (pirin superfamily)